MTTELDICSLGRQGIKSNPSHGEMTLASNSWAALAKLVLAMLIWASSFVALKYALKGFHPMAVVFGRMVVAGLCFLPLLKGWRGNVRYLPGDWKWLFLMALLQPCICFVCETLALTYTSASQAGMIFSTQPLMVAGAAVLLLKEKITSRAAFGFALAIAGAIWLSLAGAATESAPAPAFGNLLEFLAVASVAGYTVLFKRLCLRYPPLVLTAMQAYIGIAFFLPLAIAFPSTVSPDVPLMTPALAIIYLGVFVTLVGYSLYNMAVSRIPASRAAAFTNLIPVFAVLMGQFVLGETLTPTQYLAAALTLSGVILSQT
ncbi:DMT family transporter [Desulfovibrio aminophilus]|uniref:DMT family transporter n=1 Tax=Desulfovibrio aminophilus TaxID=81425 RepID=UPI001FE0A1F5|nr:DMT family transporter [Desulfovibrio aminophilus]